MCRLHKDFFSFLSIYGMVHCILIRLLTAHLGISNNRLLLGEKCSTKCEVFSGVMVRVLDSRTGHSGFESHSALIFFTLILCCFVKDKFYF